MITGQQIKSGKKSQ